MKYRLTNNKKEHIGGTLYQIQALIDIPAFRIKAGELGGYIEKESNLSQDGDAWVYGNAYVFENARVYGDAQVYDNALVYGTAQVSGKAQVYGRAWVSGSAWVYGNAIVFCDAWVYGGAWVYGNAIVFCDAWVYGGAWVYGNAYVYGNAQVYGNARVSGDARVYGNARIESKLDLVCLTAPKYDLTLTNAGLSIGCEFHSMTHWLSEYKQIGNKHNFTDKEIKHYFKLIKTIDKIYKAQQELKE